MAISNYSVTVTLSETFAAEQGISDPAEAFRALLHEYVALSDALWDEKFAHSGDRLDRLAAQVDEQIAAGLVEDFDPDYDTLFE